MNSFKAYLVESERRSHISIEEAAKLINTECSGYLKTRNTIYRGAPNTRQQLCALLNTERGAPRKSASGLANYYTLWIDNNPKWKDFPQRSRSAICATKQAIASGFGTVHLVIPFDDCHVGITPSDDIWTAFHLDDTLDNIMNNLEKTLGGLGLPTEFDSYDSLVAALKDVTVSAIRETEFSGIKAVNGSSAMADLLSTYKVNSAYEFFEKKILPSDFEHYKASEMPKVDGWQEIYIQGSMVMIHRKEFIDASDNEIEPLLFLHNHLGMAEF